MKQKERYKQIWECGDVQKPGIWSVWEIIKDFKGKRNLDVGPGNYPKIPIENGFFVDISQSAVENLKRSGGKAFMEDVTNLPFENEFFDLVVAIEVLEHIENDKKAFSEIARVLKPSGFFLFSVPLKKELFNEIDSIVGHKRRYEITELKTLLLDNKFKILKYRYPSSYRKIIDLLPFSFHIMKFCLKHAHKGHIKFFPKLLVNLYPKGLAFLDRKGAPKWRADVDNLSRYKDKSIVLFCQMAKHKTKKGKGVL